MSLFTKLARDIFSPVDAAGNLRAVQNGEVQAWGSEVERMLAVFQAGGGIIFPDLETANASLAYNQNQMAWVMGDPTPANNGVYRKVGASGSGSWARMGDLPISMIRLDNAGAGTADAIIAEPMLPMPTTPGAALLTVNILAANTGNVTLNGKPLRTNSGNEIAPGGLTAGSIHAFLDLGDHFRLLSDQTGAAIVAAAEAAQAAAEAAAAGLNLPSINPGDAGKALVVKGDETGFELGGGGAADDITYDNTGSGLSAGDVQAALDELAGRDVIRTADRIALKALDGTKTPVAVIYAEGGRSGMFAFAGADLSAQVTADALEGIYIAPASDDTGASGAWVRLVGNAYDLRWWGTVGDGVTDDASAIQAAIDTVLALGGGTLIGPIGAHLCESTITISGRLTLQGATAAIPAVAEGSPDNECFTLLFDLANGVDGLVVADAAARIDGASVEDVFIKRSTLEVIAGGGFGGGRGLKVLGVVNPRFENVHIHNFAIDLEVSDIASGPTSGGSFNGVRCSTAARIQLLVRGAIDVCFNDCIFGGREGGNIYNAALAWSDNTRRPNACHFTNCMFIESGGTRPTNNLRIVNGFWNTFQNCVFERAGNHSIRVTYDSALSPSIMGAIFDGCHTNDPGLACILVDAEVSNVQLLNCRLHQGNTAVSPNTCVRFEHAAAAQASHRIAGNTIRFDGYGGVRVNNAGGVIVSQNRILGSGTGTGVVLQSGASKCIVSENVFSGISTDVGDAGTSNIKPNNQTI